MTENHSRADLEALASDPNTQWDVLHWIAENHPELHPAVAANPGTYEELVEALGRLGAPEVEAAIAQRRRQQQEASSEESPLAGMWDEPTGEDNAGESGEDSGVYGQEPDATEPPDASGPLGEGAQPALADRESAGGAAASAAEDAPEDEDVYEEDREGAGASAMSPGPISPSPVAAAPMSGVPGPDMPAERQSADRRKALVLIAAAAAAVLLFGAALAVVLNIFGGEDEQAAEPPPEPAPSPTATAPTEGETEEGMDEEALADAQAAVTALPEDTSCDQGEDAGVVGSLVSASAVQEGWPGAEDTDLLEDSFAGLQEECDTLHAASVFTAVQGGDQAEGGTGEALETVSTDWVDRTIDLQGAQRMGSFEIHDGNIQCEFDGEGLRCTVYDHDYSAPSGCEEGMTYRMELDGTAYQDCDHPVEQTDGRQALATDQRATDGFTVCYNTSNRITCYSTLTSYQGFELSEIGHYPVGQ